MTDRTFSHNDGTLTRCTVGWGALIFDCNCARITPNCSAISRRSRSDLRSPTSSRRSTTTPLPSPYRRSCVFREMRSTNQVIVQVGMATTLSTENCRKSPKARMPTLRGVSCSGLRRPWYERRPDSARLRYSSALAISASASTPSIGWMSVRRLVMSGSASRLEVSASLPATALANRRVYPELTTALVKVRATRTCGMSLTIP